MCSNIKQKMIRGRKSKIYFKAFWWLFFPFVLSDSNYTTHTFPYMFYDHKCPMKNSAFLSPAQTCHLVLSYKA